MSRIPREDVWAYTFDNQIYAKCPCCMITKLHRFSSKGKHAWARGHIIPARMKPPDIIENIRPICIECNKNDKSYDSNYHYMVVINTMTIQERDEKLKTIKYHIKRVIDDPKITLCIGFNAYGEPCTFQKKARSPFCKKCSKNKRKHLCRYMLNSHAETLTVLLQLTQNESIYDDDELEDIKAGISEFERQIKMFRRKL